MFNIDDFFKIFKYIKDGQVDQSIPPEIREFAKNSKIQSQAFFKNILDQIPFNSDDYNRLRKLLIDWNSTHKTLSTIGKNTSDAFNLSHPILDVAFKSFGFPYSKGLNVRLNKALFLHNLTELYKIKGTPKAIKNVLEFFGIYHVHIFEWWLKRDYQTNELFFESSFVDIDDSLTNINNPYLHTQKIQYDAMVLDNHWHHTKEGILIADDYSQIKLPSLTPYFTIQANATMHKSKMIYSLISRKINNQYNEFVNHNTLDKEISISIYEPKISLLELILAIGYVYNTWTGRTHGSNAESYIQYRGDIDIDDDSELIIDEYNNIVSKPSTRQEQKEKREEFAEKFTRPQNENFMTSVEDGVIRLEQINSSFKDWIDSEIVNDELLVNLLKELLHRLDVYIRMEYGVQILSYSNLLLGLTENVNELINFFKPKKARLKSFNIMYEINEPLFDSILLDYHLFQIIRQWDYEYIPDFMSDHLTHTKITQWDYDCLFRAPGGDFPNSMGYDVGNMYDKIPYQIYDELFLRILQSHQNSLSFDDMMISNIVFNFFEYGHLLHFDMGGIFDALDQVYDKLNYTKITQKLETNATGYLRFFDTGYDFDVFSKSLRDYFYYYQKEQFIDNIILNQDQISESLKVSFFEPMETWPTSFDSAFYFDVASKLIRDISFNIIYDKYEDQLQILDNFNHSITEYSYYLSFSWEDVDSETKQLYVNHNLGNKYVYLVMYNNQNQRVYKPIILIDENNLRVDFSDEESIEDNWSLLISTKENYKNTTSFNYSNLDPSKSITINHNLDFKYVSVVIYNENDIKPDSISYNIELLNDNSYKLILEEEIEEFVGSWNVLTIAEPITSSLVLFNNDDLIENNKVIVQHNKNLESVKLDVYNDDNLIMLNYQIIDSNNIQINFATTEELYGNWVAIVNDIAYLETL